VYLIIREVAFTSSLLWYFFIWPPGTQLSCNPSMMELMQRESQNIPP